MTWLECAREIDRCRDESGGIFFISLQSEKYGYCPLPKSIPKDIFEDTLSSSTLTDAIELAKKWYVLDENNIPAEYRLTHINDTNSNEYWSTALPELLKLFQDVPCYSSMCTSGKDFLIGRSVTEYEFKYAAQTSTDVCRCLWFRRKFEDAHITKAIDPNSDFCDTHEDVSRLKKQNLFSNMEILRDEIMEPVSERGEVVSIPLASYISDVKDDSRLQYEIAWYEMASGRLHSELSAIIERYKQWEMDGCGIGMSGKDLDEILHHYEWCRAKCATFVGREDLVQECMNVICPHTDSMVQDLGKALDNTHLISVDSENGSLKSPLSQINLSIVGKSGTVIYDIVCD
jgi:hypothetical protein